MRTLGLWPDTDAGLGSKIMTEHIGDIVPHGGMLAPRPGKGQLQPDVEGRQPHVADLSRAKPGRQERFTVKVSRRWNRARVAVMCYIGRYAHGEAAPLGLVVDYYA